MPDVTDDPHADFEILIEKRLHGADSPEEAADLNRHLRDCQPCNHVLQTTRTEEEMLNQDVANYIGDFDWNAAEQAIRNRVDRERAIGRAPRVFALLVLLVFFWPVATAAGWQVYLGIALPLVATFAYWDVVSRRRPQRLFEKAMQGEGELVAAFENHSTDLQKERRAERVAAVIGAATIAGFAVYSAITGGWFGWAIAALLLWLAWTIAAESLAPKNRERNDLLDRGEISWRDYLLWSAHKADSKDRPTPKPPAASLQLIQLGQGVALAILLILMVEYRGVWLWAGAGVALYYLMRVCLQMVLRRRQR